MKKIKYLMLTLMMVLGVGAANASEDGANAVGFNLGYATGSNGVGNFGIGVKYSHNLSEALRVQPSFTYYFTKDDFSMYDISCDFHYLFDLGNDKSFAYPIFGFNLPLGDYKEVREVMYDNDYDVKKDTHRWSRFGCNLGAGFQHNLTDDFGIVAEAKYHILKDFGHLSIAIGCVVTF